MIDYTLSDFSSADALLNISARFPEVHWILFSEELSAEFLKKVIIGNKSFSVVLKNAELAELEAGIVCACRNETFICSQIQNLLLVTETGDLNHETTLTTTEKEILKEIAWGKTAKEIASIRKISVYTVVTHRKNIYRKLGVNNSQEASRYALRAGIIDASDYYI